jgi:hypothetical protein
METERRSANERHSLSRQWTGVLLPPIAWLTQLQTQLTLVPIVCVRGGGWSLHAATAGALALALLGARMAWVEWRRAGSAWPGAESDKVTRSRFLSAIGLLTAALFSALVLAQGAAALVYDPCD